MKLRKLVLSFYLSNQEIIRVKTSPYVLVALVLTLSFGSGFLGYKLNNVKKSAKVPSLKLEKEIKKKSIAIKKEKTIEKVVRKEVPEEYVDNKRYEITHFKKNDGEVSFFLSNNSESVDPRKGVVKIKSLVKNGLEEITESFEFKRGRYTKIPVLKDIDNQEISFLIEIIENREVALKQKIVLKDNQFKVITR